MKWESYSHPISDIRDWDNNNRLELKPDFQRNEVWSRAAQIMLIDTIIKGIPIPKIYIKSVMHNGNTYRVVIDGQQRLTAILKFVKNKLRLSKPYSGEYEGSLFSDLPDEVQNEILRYKIDINEIFNPSEEEIRDLYSRVISKSFAEQTSLAGLSSSQRNCQRRSFLRTQKSFRLNNAGEC